MTLRAVLSSEPESQERLNAITMLGALPDELRIRMQRPLQRLKTAPAGTPTSELVQEVRRIWRGI